MGDANAFRSYFRDVAAGPPSGTSDDRFCQMWCLQKQAAQAIREYTVTCPHHRHAHAGRTRKNLNRMFLLRFCCGATGNRTRDTRIFSPLLYQLSYGTIVCLELPFLPIGIAKVDIFS